MQNYRAGDIVTIRATVTRDFDPNTVNNEDYFKNKVTVQITEHGQNVYVEHADVTLLTPIFRKEERVAKKEAPHIKGTVAAVLDGFVWLRFDDGKLGTIEATELQVAA